MKFFASNFARIRVGGGVPTGAGLLALSPIAVFLLLYLGVSLAVGDFYSVPISVALLVASVWGVAFCPPRQERRGLAERIEVYSRSAAHPDIMYMIWVFVLAGAFAELAKSIGAVDTTVAFVLRAFPPGLLLPGLFVGACVVSFAIGTSVGTVVALTPLAVEMAVAGNASVALFVAVVLGGAFFGDNLSFISDTTIAATRSQGCNMSDKFKANFRLVLPAALGALVIYAFFGGNIEYSPIEVPLDAWLVLPYLVVIVLAIMGVNVTLVLSLGIVSALVVGAAHGSGMIDLARSAGDGIGSMGNLIVITLMSAGMLGTIKAAGGIAYLLDILTRRVRRASGAKGCIAGLVALVNLCTANNTVAIITVGPVARDIAGRFGIAPRKSASLLDTCSCIVQCLIPYGAQTLMATTLAGISPASPLAYQVYPAALAVMVFVAILFDNNKPVGSDEKDR